MSAVALNCNFWSTSQMEQRLNKQISAADDVSAALSDPAQKQRQRQDDWMHCHLFNEQCAPVEVNSALSDSTDLFVRRVQVY